MQLRPSPPPRLSRRASQQYMATQHLAPAALGCLRLALACWGLCVVWQLSYLASYCIKDYKMHLVHVLGSVTHQPVGPSHGS